MRLTQIAKSAVSGKAATKPCQIAPKKSPVCYGSDQSGQ